MLLKQKKMNSLYIENHSLIETIKRVNKLKERNIIYGYFFGRSLLQTVKMVLITFFALEVLKTALNIGIFEFMIGIISILITSKLTNFKHSKNRMKLMLISIILNIIAYLILFITNFSIIGYTLFSLILIIATPMYFTAQSLLDLYTVDLIKEKNSNIIPVMYRDTVVFFTRMIGVVLCLILLNFNFEELTTSLLLTSLLIVGMFIQYYFGNKMFKKLN